MEQEYTGGSFSVHLIAGAVAGSAEHLGMFPVDTVKVRRKSILDAIMLSTPLCRHTCKHLYLELARNNQQWQQLKILLHVLEYVDCLEAQQQWPLVQV